MTNRIPLAAVLGHPVAHSRSPVLHGHWLARYGIAGHYVPIDVAPDHLADTLRQLPSLGFVGANVTIPHKEAARALATTSTDRARAIGAANTLTFGADGAVHAVIAATHRGSHSRPLPAHAEFSPRAGQDGAG